MRDARRFNSERARRCSLNRRRRGTGRAPCYLLNWQISLSQEYRHLSIAHSAARRGAGRPVLICQGRGDDCGDDGDASELTGNYVTGIGAHYKFTLARWRVRRSRTTFPSTVAIDYDVSPPSSSSVRVISHLLPFALTEN